MSSHAMDLDLRKPKLFLFFLLRGILLLVEIAGKVVHFLQTMSILIVNQSVIDMFASFFNFLLLMDREMTGLSNDSPYDQFLCRFWLTRKPLWCMLITSTYGTVTMTLSRYVAVIYPIQYKTVRISVTIVAWYRFCPVRLLSKL